MSKYDLKTLELVEEWLRDNLIEERITEFNFDWRTTISYAQITDKDCVSTVEEFINKFRNYFDLK